MNTKAICATGLAAMLLTACGNAGIGAPPPLPEGETNLTCAGAIYAATQVVSMPLEDASFTEYLGVMTRYGTAHAEAEGITDGNEVLNIIKNEAYLMTGTIPGRSVVSSESRIKERAQACYGA